MNAPYFCMCSVISANPCIVLSVYELPRYCIQIRTIRQRESTENPAEHSRGRLSIAGSANLVVELRSDGFGNKI